MTAVRADHGPPEVAARNGPVIGFVLRGAGLPTIYVSGDNSSVDVAREIASEHGPFDTTCSWWEAPRSRRPGARAST